jgi:mercuric ion binding protein
MKKFVFTFILLTVAALGATSLYAEPAVDQTASFSVEKMTCATCPIAVRKAMERVDGVKSVVVDLDAKNATVVFDSSKATVGDIAAASTNVGFPATVVESQNK